MKQLAFVFLPGSLLNVCCRASRTLIVAMLIALIRERLHHDCPDRCLAPVLATR